jgi:hypothetical protein
MFAVLDTLVIAAMTQLVTRIGVSARRFSPRFLEKRGVFDVRFAIPRTTPAAHRSPRSYTSVHSRFQQAEAAC